MLFARFALLAALCRSVIFVLSQELESSTPATTTTAEPVTSSSTAPAPAPLGVEILHAAVDGANHGAVRLVWGCKGISNNLTYGVHYGEDEADLAYPKLTTGNASALISELQFCTRYLFGVSVFEGESGQVQGPGRVNPNDVRTVVTGADRAQPPRELRADFLPGAQPRLLLRWAAPCDSVVEPLGYLISVLDKNQSRYEVVAVPATNRADIAYHLPARYGGEYEVSVSTAAPGAPATEPVSVAVPQFLQPWRMRVAVDPEKGAGAFLVYWAEPYVPPTLRYRYYYEVLVYRGPSAEEEPERYYVTRPAIVYASEPPGVRTFRARLVSLDRRWRRRSPFSEALAASPAGDVRVVPAPDPPDDDDDDDRRPSRAHP